MLLGALTLALGCQPTETPVDAGTDTGTADSGCSPDGAVPNGACDWHGQVCEFRPTCATPPSVSCTCVHGTWSCGALQCM